MMQIKNHFFSVTECILSLIASVYVGMFFAVMRLLPLLALPLFILRSILPIFKIIERAPFLFMIIGIIPTGYMALYGMPLLASVSLTAKIFLVLGWLLALGLTASSYMHFTAELATHTLIKEAITKRWPEKWYTNHLKNPMDAYFVRPVIGNTFMMAPAVGALIWHGSINPFSALYYLVALMITARAHEVLDHTNIHNQFFNSKRIDQKTGKAIVWLTGKYVQYILDPLCGRIPNYYRVQHVYMHHVENNGVNDLQTTAFLDRTSFFDFCKYSLKIGIMDTFGISLFFYVYKRKKSTQYWLLLNGLAIWFAMLGLLALYNPAASLEILLVRFLMSVPSCILNYYWHGLLDPDEPENIHKNTINVVLNHMMSSDALHLRHHLRSGEHWSKCILSENEINNRPETGAVHYRPFPRSSLLVPECMFLQALWTKRYDYIARHIIPFSAENPDLEMRISLVKKRVQPVKRVTRSSFYHWLDDSVGTLFSRVIIAANLNAQSPTRRPQ